MSGRKPNLLFVFADQWRKQAVGRFGEDRVATPAIDRLSGESLTLTHAVSCYPLCSPNRAVMLTGTYPLSNGVTSNCKIGLPIKLNDEERTIGNMLSDAGYRTGYIGKWHLDEPELNKESAPASGARNWDAYIPPGPRRFGFDFWYAYNAFDRHMAPHYWTDSERMIEPREWSTAHETGVAETFIRQRDRDKPFALFVSWNPPHQPFEQVPEPYRTLYADQPLDLKPNHAEGEGLKQAERHLRDYYAAVTATDEQFARLLGVLDEEGIADDTIVVLTSDHGETMGAHGWLEHKNIWYDESIRVPFFIRWPGQVKVGENDQLFNSSDIVPTLLGLMNEPIPERVQGTDYSSLFRGEEGRGEDAAFICQYPGGVKEHEEARRQGVDINGYGWRGLRTSTHTYVVQRHFGSGSAKRLLYDNEADPYQLCPTSYDAAPADGIAGRLERKLHEWLRRLGDPFVL